MSKLAEGKYTPVTMMSLLPVSLSYLVLFPLPPSFVEHAIDLKSFLTSLPYTVPSPCTFTGRFVLSSPLLCSYGDRHVRTTTTTHPGKDSGEGRGI